MAWPEAVIALALAWAVYVEAGTDVAVTAAARSAAAVAADARPLVAVSDAIWAIVDDARATSPLGAPEAALAVGVMTGDAIVRRDWGSVDETSRFRIASITKTFTALIAMQLANEGKLDLDADVRRYVPAFPEKPWVLSARQLLSHTAGLPHYRGTKDALTRSAMTTTQSLDIFAQRALVAPPGSRYVYSSFGYNLLGVALESASGRSYATLLEERVCARAGMRDTALEGRRGQRDVAGFRLEKGRLVPSERIDVSSRFASGGVRSTADDLLRYARALLNRELVDEGTWRRMTTPVVTTDGKLADYGLGFAVYPLHGRAVVAHAGGQPEASSLLLLAPDDDTAIVLLANVEGQSQELHRIAASILAVLFDEGPHRDLYSDDVTDELAFDAMRRIFSWGVASSPLSPLPSPVPGLAPGPAFAALGPLLSTPADRARAAIADAYHPMHGSITPLVGAEMARVLIARGSSPSLLRARGPVAFFTDYIAACSDACPHPLPADVREKVERVASHWNATPPELLRLRPEHVGDALESLAVLADRRAHPSFRTDLERAAARLRGAGREQEARRALELASALHPVRHPSVEARR